MPFSGGVFSRVYNWVQDRTNGIKISASRMDQEFDGIATALSNCVLKDGSQLTTAPVPFAHGVRLAAPAPAVPQHGDVWITSDGLMMRLGSINILLMPIGLEADWGNDTPPSGWLLCAGQNVSRTTYARLFSVIGTTSGAGDGSTTFGIPDYRGRTSFGKDNMGGTAANRITAAESGINGTVLGAVGGDQRLHAHNHSQNAHTHAVSDPSHTHAVSDPGHIHGLAEGATPLAGGSNIYRLSGQGTPAGFTNTSFTGISLFGAFTGIGIFANAGTNNPSGTGASQNMPPAIIRNKIIFAGA